MLLGDKAVVTHADTVEVTDLAYLLEIADLMRGGRLLDLFDRAPDAVRTTRSFTFFRSCAKL